MRNKYAIKQGLLAQTRKSNKNKIPGNGSYLAKCLSAAVFLWLFSALPGRTQGTITGFSLINANTDKTIQTLTPGAVLDLTTLPTTDLNIRALTGSTAVGSVVFTLSGQESKTLTDNGSPYTLQGDDNSGNYYGWNPTVGNYTLTAHPYAKDNAGGTAGTPVTITFSVTNGQTNPPAQYTLNLNAVGNGTAAASPNQTTYSSGSTVTITASPGTGATFSGWTGDVNSTSNPLSITMNGNKSITANFTTSTATQPITGLLIMNAITNQVIQPLNSGMVVNLATLPNQKINIQAVTNPATVGSVLFNLSGAEIKTRTDNSTPYSLTGDNSGDYFSWIPTLGNYTLTAQSFSGSNGGGTASPPVTLTFSVINQISPPTQYTLNLNATNGGTISGNPDQATYSGNSPVVLTATPEPGFEFSGWSGDTTGNTNPLTITMNSNKSITANFTASAVRYSLNVISPGGGIVTVTPDLPDYPINSIVNVAVLPDSGYLFSGWSGDAIGNMEPLVIKLTRNMNITANFTQFNPSGYCGPNNSMNIGCFTSVRPRGQTEIITYPASHAIQLLAKFDQTRYTAGSTGLLPSNFDFSAYVPRSGSSRKGYLSLNHETTPGGVSIFNLAFNDSTNLWETDSIRKINFAPVVKTERNCGGVVTPWGTVISSEESYTAGDSNKDGYQDVGWHVEFNPATGSLMDYDDDGKADKLWAMGRMRHENLVIKSDRVTTYQTDDAQTNCLYKFVADQPGNLSAGKLYVLKRSASDPKTGQWVLVPNTSKADRNKTADLGPSLGGTQWDKLEDIELGPDGKLYFAETNTGTIWRFKDDGAGISELEPWVIKKYYPITYSGGVNNEDWGVGADNLAFDGDGNLWVLQDKGRHNVWVVRPDHTTASPKIELFMTTPKDAEPSGLTFTPDYRYGFISFLNPSNDNTKTIKDVAGNTIRFEQDVTIVFARKEFLGPQTQPAARVAPVNLTPSNLMLEVFPNPFDAATTIKVNLPEKARVKLEVYSTDTDIRQTFTLVNEEMEAGTHNIEFKPAEDPGHRSGIYRVRLKVNDQQIEKSILQMKE
ncbi:DUF839 domain-containing protein [Adhaeribacter sp. BT258]|uniref:DUF839 domain-containing protein n=1 Tax=Adhaeribacter terrigena TaxID=2793070 RepID=A0ABS1C3F0_9BACT|nr:alkaline phosphatase PhoX [Adhaeribacter terrigena]MBK0403671.1 DUF839 domain-containing protein [Adhaeribacter terrigena]